MANELMTLEAVERSEGVSEIKCRSRTLAANAANIVVKDDASAQGATDFLVKVKTALKTAESMRKSMTTGIVEAKKNIDRLFKQLVKPYAEAETTVKDKLRSYVLEQERLRAEEEERQRKEQEEREAERARLEAEAAEKGEELPPIQEPEVVEEPTMTEPLKTVRGMEGGSASMKKVWKYEIVDPTLIPGAFWIIDEKAIQKAINLGARDIPGTRIYEDIQVAVRR